MSDVEQLTYVPAGPDATVATFGWRVCIDFGTAFSKAALCRQTSWFGDVERCVHPLSLGSADGAVDPLLMPSAILVDRGRLHFGRRALSLAANCGPDREPLLSFKMLLGASDLGRLLAQRVKPAVDPTGRLLNRDMLALYVGYLYALIRQSVCSDPVLQAAVEGALWRYCRPEWPRAQARVNQEIAGRVFEEGLLAGRLLGPALTSSEGVSIDDALSALQTAYQSQGQGLVEGSVLEAHASAIAYAGAAKLSAEHVVVCDIGAGTTDMAAFRLRAGASGTLELTEIAEVRRSFPNAGDEIDEILVNVLLERAKAQTRDASMQAQFWREMLIPVRDLKREVFTQESYAIKWRDLTLVVRRGELEYASELREFARSLRAQLEQSLELATAAAKADGKRTVGLILSGGGGELPFVQELVRDVARNWRKRGKVILEEIPPAWLTANASPVPLRAQFNQLSVAIGGASPLAPVSLLA